MKRIFSLVSIVVLIVSCSTEKQGNLIVNGTVDGLKLGTIYLQQLNDTVLVNVDSVIVDGEAPFQLASDIEEPQIMYLYLDKKDGIEFNDRISFFAQDTIMTIATTLENFENDAVVTGGANQAIYTKFLEVNKKLNQEYTELIKRNIILNQSEKIDPLAVDSLQRAIEKHTRRKVGYVVNYAQLHKENEVAAYILATEATEANPFYLDSIYKQMPKKIQTSRYGKQLSELIKSTN